MMGKASRDKGKRGEYLLRDYLRQRGWKADRVPGSGAFSYRIDDKEGHLKGDVTAEKDGIKARFEMKYHESFGKIYELYEEHVKLKQDDVLAFVCPNEKRLCLAMSTSLDAVFDGPGVYEFQNRHPLFEKFKRTFGKLAGMQRLLGTSDILVLKKNHKPLLFIRYL